jgi:hypothetical protein
MVFRVLRKILKTTDVKANRIENFQANSIRMKREIVRHKRIIIGFILKGQ